MKIYLAGKMDATHGAWRDGILQSVYDHDLRRHIPRWELVRKIPKGYDQDDIDLAGVRWSTTQNRYVLGLHEYTGPYRMTFEPSPMSKHAGYFHGSTGLGQHGWMDDEQRRIIVRECFAAIQRSDFIFAYLNIPDCYGTVAELGYALALGKYVHIVVAEESCWGENDYWLMQEEAAGHDFDMAYERQDGESEQARVRRLFEGALVRWTGRSERSAQAAPLSLVQPDEDLTAPYIRAMQESAHSFSQIARWSSDPRVRNEAQRMLKRITG